MKNYVGLRRELRINENISLKSQEKDAFKGIVKGLSVLYEETHGGAHFAVGKLRETFSNDPKFKDLNKLERAFAFAGAAALKDTITNTNGQITNIDSDDVFTALFFNAMDSALPEANMKSAAQWLTSWATEAWLMACEPEVLFGDQILLLTDEEFEEHLNFFDCENTESGIARYEELNDAHVFEDAAFNGHLVLISN